MENSEIRIFAEYGKPGDDIYYHHTRTVGVGRRYYLEPGAHSQYEMLYLIEGELSYVIEGDTYKVERGDMIFVAPNEIHTLEINGEKPYERRVLLFDMKILDLIIRSVGASLPVFSGGRVFSPHVIKRERVEAGGIGEIFREITETASEERYIRLEVLSKLIRFAVAIDRLLTSDTSPAPLPDSSDKMVTAVTEYVLANIEKPIRLEDIANRLYVSKSTLSHRFFSSMGISVGRYVTMKKIYHADDLMRSGVLAKDAALMVGYDNYTSFFHSYREITGRVPSDNPHLELRAPDPRLIKKKK